MIICLKNKDTLIVDDFHLKCCIGKKGLNSQKKEGDYTTPKGSFNINKLYFRKDRVGENRRITFMDDEFKGEIFSIVNE